MAKIQFVVPKIDAKKFSGGLLCIFEYANQLIDRGHDVKVTPLSPSKSPIWFENRFDINLSQKRVFDFKKIIIEKNNKKKFRISVDTILSYFSNYGGYINRRNAELQFFCDNHWKEADITIATGFETALPVASYAKGKKFYFLQHYEPYFTIDIEYPEIAYHDAIATYFYDLNIIANSTWLASELNKKHNLRDISVNCNAIDFSTFFPDGSPPNQEQEFRVISYGGRLATWKGFVDAAKAINLARQSIPQLTWHVYGDAVLPPNNDIAPYKSLGFITGGDLRKAYSQSHAILCPSWYESFPLYPLEAMACGAAVITTPYGVEDYAKHECNALYVIPQNPESMAQAIEHLYFHPEIRKKLIENGISDAKYFDWYRAAQSFESILFDKK